MEHRTLLPNGPRINDGNVRVHYAVEHSPSDLEAFLNDVLRCHHDQDSAIFVVKEMPHTWSDAGEQGRGAVLAALRRFTQAVEARVSRGGLVAPVVFLHTVHDTHSTKLDLHRTFPNELLDSRCTQQFRCPPATTLSVASRLRAVSTLALGFNKAMLVPTELIEAVSDAANGDMRQALLQLQWMLLSIHDMPLPAASISAGVVSNRRGGGGGGGGGGGVDAPITRHTDVVDLLSDDIVDVDDEDDENLAAVTPASDVPVASKVNLTCREQLMALQRDDYIDVAHGAARVLTQKYSVEDVLAKLSVPPERLMTYIAGNAYRYFSPTLAGMLDLAQTATMISAFDVASATAKDPATRVPSSKQALTTDEVSIRVFGFEYAALKNVAPLTDFVGLSPLPPVTPHLAPYCTTAMPASATSLDDDNSMAVGVRKRRVDRWTPDNDMAPFASRLRVELQPLTSSSGTDAAMLDWLPLLPDLVLESTRFQQPKTVQPSLTPSPPPAVSRMAPLPPKPKRTLFVSGGGGASSTPSLPAAPYSLHMPEAILTLARHQPYSMGPRRFTNDLLPCVVVVPTASMVVASGDADDPITDD